MLETFLYITGGLILIAYALHKYLNRNQDYWTKRHIFSINRTTAGWSSFYKLLTGSMRIVDFEIGNYVDMGDKRYGGMVDSGTPTLMIKDPDLIRQVLVKDFDHFVDRRVVTAVSEPVIAKMLVSLEGQEWKNVRTVMTPTFTTGKIRRMFEIFNSSGEGLVEFVKGKRSQEKASSSSSSSSISRDINIKEVASRFLIDVIAKAAFGMETSVLKEKNSRFYEMGKRMMENSALKVAKNMLLFIFPFLSKFGMRFMDHESMTFFENTLMMALKERESGGGQQKRDDFIQLMLEARRGDLKTDETELGSFEKDAQLKQRKEKVALSDEMIMAQCLLFFIAGLDTTGSLVSSAYYLLALNPDVQEKLYDEVKKTMDDNGGRLDYEAANRLDYLDKIMFETLRMYSPVPRHERRCTQRYTIPGTTDVIEKDVIIGIPVSGLHRDPKYYPNPDRFDPERFSVDEKGRRHAYAYIPFGIGPRNCIGMRFALMEAKVNIAYLVYNFVIEPCASTPIPFKADAQFGTRPDDGVELRFRERQRE